MTSLAIVPARGGSKRIKEKNITDFCGKPLIAHSIEAAQKSLLFDTIHVSTESEKIKLVAEALQADTAFPRDPSLADDQTGIVPVLRWVLREFMKRGEYFDDVCMLMPTAPLILPLDLTEAYTLFLDKKRSYPVVAVTSYPVPVEWAYDYDTKTKRLSRAFANKLTSIRSQDLSVKYYDAGAFAFFNTEQLLDERYDISLNIIGYILPKYRSVDIDDPDDLEFARRLYKGQ